MLSDEDEVRYRAERMESDRRFERQQLIICFFFGCLVGVVGFLLGRYVL